MKPAQVFHPHTSWEETPMWRRTPRDRRPRAASEALCYLKDPSSFRRCLLRVLNEWPVSVEHNLTDPHINRAAWLWHAASYLETGASEEITRSLWMRVTPEQRREANRIAWDVIREWEERYQPGERTCA